MVVTTTWQFHLKSKVRLELSRWPQTQSPVHWNKHKCWDGRPTGSMHKLGLAKAYTVRVSQQRLLCLSLIGAYQNYVLCRLICMPINIGSTAKLRNKLLKRQRWVWRRFWWTYAVVDIGYVFHKLSRDAVAPRLLWRGVTKRYSVRHGRQLRYLYHLKCPQRGWFDGHNFF